MEPGVFVTFFEVGESSERELPPVGPLDHLVVRQGHLVADRRSVHQPPEVGVDPVRLLEAELELQRALGKEAGVSRRGALRITAADGILVRFAAFGDEAERDLAPELGPFALVIVGLNSVVGDGRALATRPVGANAWNLKTAPNAAALRKRDVAFRTPSTAYHPAIKPLPQPSTEAAAAPAPDERPSVTLAPPAFEPPPLVWDPRELLAPPPPATPGPIELAPLPAPAPPVRKPPVAEPPPPEPAAPERPLTEQVFLERAPREREIYTPPSPAAQRAGQALVPGDVELIKRLERDSTDDTLRARLRDQQRRRVENAGAEEDKAAWSRYRPLASNEEIAAQETETADAGFDPVGLLWRLRFLIIGLLVLGAGAYGYTVVSSTLASGNGAQVRTVGLGQRVSSERWDYTANVVQRFDTVGRKKARGTYVVVRMSVTNKTGDGAQLAPSQFTLIDSNGVAYAAESLASGAYTGTDNPQSPFPWPEPFGAGKSATVGVIFDIDPSAPKGLTLAFSDVPTTRVRID